MAEISRESIARTAANRKNLLRMGLGTRKNVPDRERTLPVRTRLR
jgi:hypothetical protein